MLRRQSLAARCLGTVLRNHDGCGKELRRDNGAQLTRIQSTLWRTEGVQHKVAASLLARQASNLPV